MTNQTRTTMELSQTALVLIDMQKESKYGIENLEGAVAATIPLIATCRELGIPILYTRHISRADAVGLPNKEALDETGKPLYYRSDSDTMEIINPIASRPEDIV